MEGLSTLLDQQVMPLSPATALSLLKQCIRSKDMALGRQVHALAIASGLGLMAHLGDHLIHMLSSCGGTLLEANLAFCNVAQPCSLTWHAIISAHSDLGESESALHLFEKMQVQSIKPSKYMFSSALKACGSMGVIGHGRIIHGLINRAAVESDVVLRGGLITMYARCGSLEEAHCIFDKMLDRNVVIWGALISGYAQHGHGLLALELLEKMQAQGLVPDKALFLSILKACSSTGIVEQGKLVHGQIVNMGLDSNVVVGSSLLDMYAKCGHLEEAQGVFYRLPIRNVVSWGALIAGYAQHGQGHISLKLFGELQKDGIKPDNFIYSSILKACSSVGAIREGRQIHDRMVRSGLELDVNMLTTLVDLYAKWGCLKEAFKLFETVENRNVVSWNAMIAGCAENTKGLLALELFGKMQEEGVKPDKVTFLLILKACRCVGVAKQGRLIHREIVERGFESDKMVRSTLVDMYAKCGSLQESRKVFDGVQNKDSVSWAAMIAGYAQHGHGPSAFKLFGNMQQEGLGSNRVALSCILKSCGSIGQGRLIHEQIITNGLELDVVVASALIDMYAKYGSLKEAHKVLDGMPNKNIVAWNSIIAGHTQHEHGLAALEYFAKMQQEGIHADKVTYLSLLRACGSLGALGLGKEIHHEIIISGHVSDSAVGTSLVDMYGKCGSLDAACKVFDDLPKQSVVLWNALIAGYARHGKHGQALQCFDQLPKQGLKPEERTYTSIFGACSQEGKVKDGQLHFEAMKEVYGITPSTEHFNGVVDLLCRAGCLLEAEELLCSASIPLDITGWTSLLTACKTYGNVELGWKCFQQVVLMDPSFAAAHVVMEDMHRRSMGLV